MTKFKHKHTGSACQIRELYGAHQLPRTTPCSAQTSFFAGPSDAHLSPKAASVSAVRCAAASPRSAQGLVQRSPSLTRPQRSRHYTHDPQFSRMVAWQSSI